MYKLPDEIQDMNCSYYIISPLQIQYTRIRVITNLKYISKGFSPCAYSILYKYQYRTEDAYCEKLLLM